MVSLSLDRLDYRPRRHVEEHNLTWPNISLGTDSDIATAYGVYGVPAYFVVGKSGAIAANDTWGFSDLRQFIEDELRR